MPNRVMKESIHTSEKVNAMTDFQFRLWVSLITYVDDYGRGDARAAIIKGSCFPLRDRLTNKDIDAALTGLAGIGCIGLYTVDGRPYLYFPNWEEHQTIRNKRSRFPAPPDNLKAIENNCNQAQAIASIIQSNPNTNPNPNPIQGEKARATPRFAAPSVAEIEDFCRNNDLAVDAQTFVDYYTSKGWLVGKSPMKDWKAAVRNWARRDRERGVQPSKTRMGQPEYAGAEQSEEDKIAMMRRMLGAGKP